MNRFMVSVGFGFLLVLLITFANPASAEFPVSIQGSAVNIGVQQPIVWHTDLQSGWREAKRRNVPMVIFITTESCIYCDAMKRDTWCNQSVRDRLSGKFVAIRLTKKLNQKTLSRIKVPTYPTTLFGTPNGKIIGHRAGYQPPAEMHGFLTEAESTVANSRMTASNIH